MFPKHAPLPLGHPGNTSCTPQWDSSNDISNNSFFQLHKSIPHLSNENMLESGSIRPSEGPRVVREPQLTDPISENGRVGGDRMS